jgi:hypothetical protein
MKTFRYIDNDARRNITDGRELDHVPQQGEIISPFNTPNGRVIWEVVYVEDIDLDYTFVYVRHKGFQKE